MKNLILSVIISITSLTVFASTNPVDSLQAKFDLATSDVVKAKLLTKMATSYMNYSALQDKQVKTDFQENALKYTYQALHFYSRNDDSTGLRVCYDRLARVYRDQRKFTQAKWFILQANTMARAQNDVPNITKSLITLAGIKMDIKDFDLAERDLGEALELSSINRFSDQQADVMLGYSRLYKGLHRPVKAIAAEQRYSYIKDSMKRDSQSRIVKVVTKKKFFTVNNRESKNTTTASITL